MRDKEKIDPEAAKRDILAYCLRKGALAAGVADLASASPRPATGPPT